MTWCGLPSLDCHTQLYMLRTAPFWRVLFLSSSIDTVYMAIPDDIEDIPWYLTAERLLSSWSSWNSFVYSFFSTIVLILSLKYLLVKYWALQISLLIFLFGLY